MLKKRVPQSHLKIALVRPAIVISAFSDPMCGWTETISAMGGILFATMLGLINFVHTEHNHILDIVPVDFVSNLIICATAFTARCPPGTLKVLHSSTSQHNPCTISEMADILLEYTQYNPSFKQVLSPHLQIIPDERVYDTIFYLKQHLPL